VIDSGDSKEENVNTEVPMMRHSFTARTAVVLAMSWLLFYLCAVSEATAVDPRKPAVTQRANAPARLIIRRNPNLGFNVIVRLWIDGVSAGAIGYGHAFEGYLAPGHHVLAVLATPNPRWPTPWQLPLDVQSGQTYGFTAVGDSSGNLILDGRFGFPQRVQ
jgi:hypothetical protein